MIKEEWFKEADDNRDKLISLVSQYHPSSQRAGKSLRITAFRAEQACAEIRKNIKTIRTEDPVERFKLALDLKDTNTSLLILNETWFGVPESTDCWSIPGFSEAVDLMTDPPE